MAGYVVRGGEFYNPSDVRRRRRSLDAARRRTVRDEIRTVRRQQHAAKAYNAQLEEHRRKRATLNCLSQQSNPDCSGNFDFTRTGTLTLEDDSQPYSTQYPPTLRVDQPNELASIEFGRQLVFRVVGENFAGSELVDFGLYDSAGERGWVQHKREGGWIGENIIFFKPMNSLSFFAGMFIESLGTDTLSTTFPIGQEAQVSVLVKNTWPHGPVELRASVAAAPGIPAVGFDCSFSTAGFCSFTLNRSL